MRSTFLAHFLIFGAVATALAQSQQTEPSSGQRPLDNSQPVVRITGVRFSYPLVQHWIDRFNKEHPNVQVIIESRGSSDPSQFDIMVEAYEQPEEIKKDREYLYFARYAVLPVANGASRFVAAYKDKGLNKDLITQLFFFDIYAEKEKQKQVREPFTVYTRLQKAGVPIVFSKYFGYAQKDLKGTAIAGADEHLLKAVLRDSSGISYAPLPLIYNPVTGLPVEGLVVLPVDLNGNGRVSEEEKGYDRLPEVMTRLEDRTAKEVQNVPLEYVHFSVSRQSVAPAALVFLKWVIANGENDLHSFGFLKPEPRKAQNERFEQFAFRQTR
ncbi:MAG: hypothetical protein M3Y60_09495 [Bacteroidota bacterium]|nr:hypothetical protein [Bacteroidota bacterium]